MSEAQGARIVLLSKCCWPVLPRVLPRGRAVLLVVLRDAKEYFQVGVLQFCTALLSICCSSTPDMSPYFPSSMLLFGCLDQNPFPCITCKLSADLMPEDPHILTCLTRTCATRTWHICQMTDPTRLHVMAVLLIVITMMLSWLPAGRTGCASHHLPHAPPQTPP